MIVLCPALLGFVGALGGLQGHRVDYVLPTPSFVSGDPRLCAEGIRPKAWPPSRKPAAMACGHALPWKLTSGSRIGSPHLF
jgi:hypothetical protein